MQCILIAEGVRGCSGWARNMLPDLGLSPAGTPLMGCCGLQLAQSLLYQLTLFQLACCPCFCTGVKRLSMTNTALPPQPC